MGPVQGMIKGDDAYPFCSVSNAAEEELAELAKLVGEGQTLHPAGEVLYQDLEELIRDNGDWVSINKAYFNANPSLNIKLFKLLLKLKQWFGEKS